jgi:HEAT repeat protein
VEEKWRLEPTGWGTTILAVHNGRVLVRKPIPTPRGAAASGSAGIRFDALPISLRDEVECRAVSDGRVLWAFRGKDAAEGRPGLGVLFGELALVEFVNIVRDRPSRDGLTSRPTDLEFDKTRYLLDAATGEVLRSFHATETYREDIELTASRPGTLRMPATWPSFDERMAQAKRFLEVSEKRTRQKLEELRQTYYAPQGPTLAAPLNPLQWTDEDTERVMQSLTMTLGVPEHGCQEWTLAREGDHHEWLDVKAVLKRSELADDYIREVWLANMVRYPPGFGGPLWRPPLVVVFTSRSAITAYEITTGKPVWMYEWPERGFHSPVAGTMMALEDGIFLVSASHAARAIVPSRGRDGGFGVRPGGGSCLVKLDVTGRPVFRQELDASDYSVVYYTQGHFVVGTVCYGPAAQPVSMTVPASAEGQAERVAQLHAQYEQGSSLDRLIICAELADLGDRTIVEKVLADLSADSSRDKQETDRYMWALALLKDPKAIPKLIEMLDDNDGWIRQQAWKHLESLTDGDPARSSEYREWLARKTSSLHAAYEQAKSAFERTEICDQLGRMGDKTITEKVLADLDKAKPGERDFYVRMLWRLGDRRGIPRLITLIEKCAPSERHEVDVALQALTGRRGPFVSDWRNWWEVHKHLYETK